MPSFLHGRRLTAICLSLIAFTACQPAASPVITPEQSPSISAVTVTPISAVLPTLPPTPADAGVLVTAEQPDLAALPKLAAHLRRVEQVLAQPNPILLLDSTSLTAEQQQAQTIAVGDARLLQLTRDATSRQPFRVEVFGIYPLRESDLTEATMVCRQQTCYRVELYHYALNFYLGAVVSLNPPGVLSINELPASQPDLPPHLVDIALEIVQNAPEVAATLGETPDAARALMASTKTALNGSRCERSQHLCVAPTFVIGQRALWTIVDLTDGVLVGLRWTTLGDAGPALTEKQLQEDVITRLYCQRSTALTRAGWQLEYMLTASDGLRIANVLYQGTPVFESAKLVDWHVSYSGTDGFGYSDAVGCPVFSQAAVIAVSPPQIEDILAGDDVIGFALTQEFWSDLWPQPCNYFYEQRYEFYVDGRFRPVVANVGRGCGDNGVYRPVTRIVTARQSTFAEWSGSAWQQWTDEGWRMQADVPAAADGAQFRVVDEAGRGFTITPGNGQFNDGGRGDNAYVYVTRHHWDRDEGDSELPTLGPCCNEDYRQGPEKFIEPAPEPLAASALVIWYVPQIENDGTPGSQYCWAETVVRGGVFVVNEYPCYSGPLFSPLTQP